MVLQVKQKLTLHPQSVQVLQFVPVSVLVSVRVSLPVTVLPQLDVTRVLRVISCRQCFLVRPLPRQQVFMVWLSL